MTAQSCNSKPYSTIHGILRALFKLQLQVSENKEALFEGQGVDVINSEIKGIPVKRGKEYM